MNETPGTLYSVGMGPGDPELLTLKALRVIQSTRLIGYFRKKKAVGHALSIAKPHLTPLAELIAFEYPLTTEAHFCSADYIKPIAAFYAQTAQAIASHLERGEDFALLCEGDPFFYGSFLHMYERLRGAFPIVVIPGVTGMSGCWTAANAPMTLGDDVLSVLPGTLEAARLVAGLAQANAAVIMKVGGNLAKIRIALQDAGRYHEAIYVERGSMAGERVLPLQDYAGETAPYFSIVLVPGCKGRRIQ